MARLTATRLESRRLVLEPLEPRHADELALVLDDVALHEFIGGRPLTAAELQARFQRQTRAGPPGLAETWLNWAVRERGAGRAVGTLQATVRVGESACAQLAWVIGRAYQHQGLAKESTGLVAAWLRSQGVGHLQANIHPHHEASAAVARSIGLEPTPVTVDGELRWESPQPG